MSRFVARHVRRKLENFFIKYVLTILCFVPKIWFYCCKKCLSSLKNPAVLICMMLVGFIQIIIILTSISSTMKQQAPVNSKSQFFQVPKEFLEPRSLMDNVLKLSISAWITQTRQYWFNHTIQNGTMISEDNSKNISNSDSNRTDNNFQSDDAASLIHYGSQDFRYPLLVDMPALVARLKAGLTVAVDPINDPHFKWLISNSNTCSMTSEELAAHHLHPYILMLIKSSPTNIENRNAIRTTWGRTDCWEDVPIRRLFLLGSAEKHDANQALLRENIRFHDLVQQDFVDHYHNNTYKIMSGFNWARQFCSRARYILFVDDDYLLQPHKLLEYLRGISEPVYRRLFAGYVWPYAWPVRSKEGNKNKWYIALREYPWNSYPPYCAAGAFVVSGALIDDVTLAMRYTKYLRFDDVYLGLVLHKLLLVPLHINAVYSFNPVWPNQPAFRDMVASHGYKNPSVMMRAWDKSGNQQRCGIKAKKVDKVIFHLTTIRTLSLKQTSRS